MYALSEGSEPSPFFNFATAPSFWTDVILLKSVSAEAVARQSYCADFSLQFTATPLAPSPPDLVSISQMHLVDLLDPPGSLPVLLVVLV